LRLSFLPFPQAKTEICGYCERRDEKNYNKLYW
jgi:hypothetical protein